MSFLLTGVHKRPTVYAAAGGAAAYTLTKYRFFNDNNNLPGTSVVSTIPVSFAASDTLQSGFDTASTVWFVSTQGVSTNDLVIWHIGWDDSTSTGSCAASTAPNGQAISTLMGPVASLNTEVRSQIYWLIATTSWAASTTRFTPAASESRTAVVLRIPAGLFNSSSPFGSRSTYNANTSTGTTVSSPAFTCTTTDAIGRLVAFNTIDADPITATPAGWQSTNALDLGAATHGFGYRTSTVAASESIPHENWTIAGDSSVTHSYILLPYTSTIDTSRTAVSSLNSSATLVMGTHYGVQARVENSVASGTDAFRWQYLHSEGSSTWTNVSDSSAVVQAVTSVYYSHGADVPNFLTGGGVYETNNNAGLTTSGTLTLGSAMASDGAYESHINFLLVSSDVAATDTVLMRIAKGDGSALDTYTFTPTIIASAGGAVAHSGEANQQIALSGTGGTILNQTSAGTNRIGIVHMSGFLGASGSTAVTWNGVAMEQTIVGAGGDCALFHIVSPPTGASSIVISGLSGASGRAVASTYTGADQSVGSGPIRATSNATATSAGPVTTTPAGAVAGDMVVDAAVADVNGDPAAGADQTQIMNDETAGPESVASYQLGADGGVMSWTLANSVYWETCAAIIKAA